MTAEADGGWIAVDAGPLPHGQLLETRREGEEGTNLCRVYHWELGTLAAGTNEWTEVHTGVTTITHHSFAVPTHWRPIGVHYLRVQCWTCVHWQMMISLSGRSRKGQCSALPPAVVFTEAAFPITAYDWRCGQHKNILQESRPDMWRPVAARLAKEYQSS